ncbi:MAG: ATP-binding protein [Gammaproteobacteria bacterium]|nr:ATP-binding protein [Gammaproteobacteria bacterium]
MVQIYGDFIEGVNTTKDCMAIDFSPSSIPLKQRWRNNGLSADFLAEYLTTFFPAGREEGGEVDFRETIKSAAGFIANELLENAMKFNDEASDYPVSIRLRLYSDKVVFMITNSVSPEAREKYRTFIETLLREDPEELYFRQLENNTGDENKAASGMGFLTMLQDYSAHLGWKFETAYTDPEIFTITTMVQLSVKPTH